MPTGRLGASSPEEASPPRGELGYFCTTSQGFVGANDTSQTPYPAKQCQAMPLGTSGTKSKVACEAECFSGSGPLVCARCGHVYDAEKEGNGTAFEDLPESWTCPVCGAPKSAYLRRLATGGMVEWVHEDLV